MKKNRLDLLLPLLLGMGLWLTWFSGFGSIKYCCDKQYY
jgi:hypothetical protein